MEKCSELVLKPPYLMSIQTRPAVMQPAAEFRTEQSKKNFAWPKLLVDTHTHSFALQALYGCTLYSPKTAPKPHRMNHLHERKDHSSYLLRLCSRIRVL